MAWDHLSINRPHLVYIILGGYTTIFMLCSSLIKEKLYIGEATVATVVGIIFGPHAANLINPLDWGNTDQITLEFSRIVLVVQCFAVGVELPKYYMNRHWKSVTLLLIPVMGFGWVMTSLFIWWMFHSHLNFLDSLCIAACVTATDPVLASSVVGKGKFAKRVPKHLRDLLSAESGCNDGMAFPFIYLALYLMHYHSEARETLFHWVVVTILYECVFGCIYGVMVGYLARRAIRYAHEHDLIDRESFLVFYFVLALFCAGSGSILGVDDLLVGFACGVGFSNDGWFQEKTEETHVSNVIDLLINLAFFVYFGTIIPWEQYNDAALGMSAWRLVVVAIFVLFFRRIPIMMMLKPIIPDVKTWREALFAGHFGPIGVGAIFVAILARAELEHGDTTPLAEVPPDSEFKTVIALIWPITTFLVITSIVVHGSSIAVFTLGRHINTLTLTFSFTTAPEDGPNWMDRLPRIASRSRTSMSRADSDAETLDEKTGTISPRNLPKNFLRRQKEDETPSRSSSRAAKSRRRKWDAGIGPGGPVSQTAIHPASRLRPQPDDDSGDIVDQSPSSGSGVASPASVSPRARSPHSPQEEIYREGDKIIVEDEDGNVLDVKQAPQGTQAEDDEIAEQEAGEIAREAPGRGRVAITEHDKKPDDDQPVPQRPVPGRRGSTQWWKSRMEGAITAGRRVSEAAPQPPPDPVRRGPARAYTFGNTVIVEDEDGEVIKQYQLDPQRAPGTPGAGLDGGKGSRDVMNRMGQYLGAKQIAAYMEKGRQGSTFGPSRSARPETEEPSEVERVPTEEDDDHIRFMLSEDGPRLKGDELINELRKMDTRTRARVVGQMSAAANKAMATPKVRDGGLSGTRGRRASFSTPAIGDLPQQRRPSMGGEDDRSVHSGTNLHQIQTTESVPGHAVADTLAHFAYDRGGKETAAQRRRRQADSSSSSVPPSQVQESGGRAIKPAAQAGPTSYLEDGETAAERRRRQAALNLTQEENSSDEEDEAPGFTEPKYGGPSEPTRSRVSPQTRESRQGVKFEESQASTDTERGHHRTSSGMRLRWGADVGKKP